MQKLSARYGVTIVAEPSLLSAKVPANEPEGNKVVSVAVEKSLSDLISALPSGTEWIKMALPPPPAGRTYRADSLISLAFAQAQLFGTVGAATPPGTVEVLGRRIIGDPAARIVKDLDLRPVYVVVNVSAASVATMSKEEQKAWGKQQAKDLLAADADARKQMLKQMFQIPLSVMEGLSELIGGMPKDQQADIVRSLGGTADQNGFNLSFSAKAGDNSAK